jgi:hypothetical protein
MKASVVIALSRQEEDTLRLNAEDLEQLGRLRLIDQTDGKISLSGLGRMRLAQSREVQFLAIIRAVRESEAALRIR